MRKKDKLERIIKVNLLTENRYVVTKILNESNSDTYFETLSGLLDFLRNKYNVGEYSLSENDLMSNFGTGGVSYGTTKKGNIDILKNGEPILGSSGKPLNRSIIVSIYRMDSGRYELTDYKSW